MLQIGGAQCERSTRGVEAPPVYRIVGRSPPHIPQLRPLLQDHPDFLKLFRRQHKPGDGDLVLCEVRHPLVGEGSPEGIELRLRMEREVTQLLDQRHQTVSNAEHEIGQVRIVVIVKLDPAPDLGLAQQDRAAAAKVFPIPVHFGWEDRADDGDVPLLASDPWDEGFSCQALLHPVPPRSSPSPPPSRRWPVPDRTSCP